MVHQQKVLNHMDGQQFSRRMPREATPVRSRSKNTPIRKLAARQIRNDVHRNANEDKSHPRRYTTAARSSVKAKGTTGDPILQCVFGFAAAWDGVYLR